MWRVDTLRQSSALGTFLSGRRHFNTPQLLQQKPRKTLSPAVAQHNIYQDEQREALNSTTGDQPEGGAQRFDLTAEDETSQTEDAADGQHKSLTSTDS